jgi:lysozyme family protein
MTPAVKAVIQRVLLHEGGIADVGDGKGVTRYGQTPDWLATWGLTPPDSPEAAAENYAAWMAKIGLDAVCDTDVTLGCAVTDWAVHSGHVTAIKGLQQALGVTPDGVLGPKTRHALLAPGNGPAWRRLTLGVHCARLEFLGRLLTDHPEKHAKYAAGWLNRMATNLRADCG